MFSPETRITLRPLSVTPAASQSDEAGFMVGDLARGEFIEVPAIAIAVIDRLRTGDSLARTAQAVRDETGVEVDVVDFVQTLLDVGFVAAVDAVPVRADGPRLTDGGRFGWVAAFLARPFYTAPAWACYATLFVFCLVMLTSVAGLRPHYGQWFFLSNPVLSLALLLVMTTPLRALHEGTHWLGIRVQGLPARVTVSRRYLPAGVPDRPQRAVVGAEAAEVRAAAGRPGP
jgi:hypothetical protein